MDASPRPRRSRLRRLPLLLALLAGLGPAVARAENTEHLLRLLQQKSCPDCQLQDADLVHADLRDADLRGARLQRANLSQARLDGAQLSGADLSFTSLQGASLRGADLRGARLEGTDLRRSDLSGAQLDPDALTRSHWQQAVGVEAGQLSYPKLHNAGVEAANTGNYPEAERLFGEAIRRQPDAAVTWVARGISRAQQGKEDEAARDFGYAATLYERAGDRNQATQLQQASERLQQQPERAKGGNGLGGQLLTGAAGLVQGLAPLAVKFLVPLAF
jgi:tetratricopeptide (TPR) repeat protein